MSREFYPIGCDHKKPNGLSAMHFLSESSGSSCFQQERLFVCMKCGDISVSGQYADGKNHFDYTGHVIIRECIAAIVRQAAFFNEQSTDEFIEDLKKDIETLKKIYPDKQ